MSQPLLLQYGNYFNVKIENAKNYVNVVPNGGEIKVLDKFESTREKVISLNDIILTFLEDQINTLSVSMSLPEEKRSYIVEKDFKQRVQDLLIRMNIVMVTLLRKIYEELSSKNVIVKDALASGFLQIKYDSCEQIQNVKILAETGYEIMSKFVFVPTLMETKYWFFEVPRNLKNLNFNSLLREAVFLLHNSKSLVLTSEGFEIIITKLKNGDLKGYCENLKKKGLEMIAEGGKKSIDIYEQVKRDYTKQKNKTKVFIPAKKTLKNKFPKKQKSEESGLQQKENVTVKKRGIEKQETPVKKEEVFEKKADIMVEKILEPKKIEEPKKSEEPKIDEEPKKVEEPKKIEELVKKKEYWTHEKTPRDEEPIIKEQEHVTIDFQQHIY